MKTRAILILSIGLLALLVFQPARAQDGGPGYVDYLATQVVLNTQATLTAYQQQQDAAAANANAAAAQAAAQQAAANAAYAAQQATLQAGQVQAALIAAQSTADAAALLATAQVQQTRTAIEMTVTAQAVTVLQTQTANNLRATSTTQALQVKATQAALEATRVAAEVKQRDDNTVATAVAVSVQATQTAVAVQAIDDAQRSSDERRNQFVGSLVISVLMVLAGLLAILLVLKFFRGLWRSRALDPTPAAPSSHSAAQAVIIYDQATGETETLPTIEVDDDPKHLEELLKVLNGQSWH